MCFEYLEALQYGSAWLKGEQRKPRALVLCKYSFYVANAVDVQRLNKKANSPSL